MSLNDSCFISLGPINSDTQLWKDGAGEDLLPTQTSLSLSSFCSRVDIIRFSYVRVSFSLWHINSTDIIWCWLCMFAWRGLKIVAFFLHCDQVAGVKRWVLVKLNYFSEVLLKKKKKSCCADRMRAGDVVTMVQQGKARLMCSYKEFFELCFFFSG